MDNCPITILSVSDVELPNLWSISIAERFQKVDLVISCGDVGSDYLAFLSDTLWAPLYFVYGNHQAPNAIDHEHQKKIPQGINIHQRCMADHSGLILAGIEGSLRYNYGPKQYSELELWLKVLSLVPSLIVNRIRFGRCLDVFITHSPAKNLLDKDDHPHRGSYAYRWFLKVFQPRLHLFGHIHMYRQDACFYETFHRTLVVNTCGFRLIQIENLNNNKGFQPGTVNIIKKGF